MISEKVELLGKGLYTNDIPGTLTISSVPTVSELDYVGSDDFDATMLDKILPEAVKEQINFRNLLEIDYNWLLRCLRILNYGPYYTTNAIWCKECGVSYGEFEVNLKTIECKPIPDGIKDRLIVKRDEFLDFCGDVTFRLPAVQHLITAYADTSFKDSSGKVNGDFAKLCYMITSISGKKNLTPFEIGQIIRKEFSSADYLLLKDTANGLTDYGLRAGGTTQCPKCGSMKASFVALAGDRFFRPTLGNLRKWRMDKRQGKDKDVSGNTAAAV